MKKNKLIPLSIAVMLVASVAAYLFSGGSEPGNQQQVGSAEGGKDVSGKGMSENFTGSSEKEVLVRPELGVSGLPPVQDVVIKGNPEVSSRAGAQRTVNNQAESLGLSEHESLDVSGSSEDEYGNTYYQIQQHYKGIPVYGARALLEVAQGKADVISGNWQLGIDVEVEPTLTSEEALRKAAEGLSSSSEIVALFKGEPELIIYVSSLQAHLAWHMRAVVFKGAQTEIVIADAHQPGFLLKEPLRRH